MMSRGKSWRVAAVVCVLLVVFLFPLFLSYRASRARESRREVERCIRENDHQKLHELLENKTNRKYVYSHDVSSAMKNGHLEVIQEISAHEDIIKTITVGGVEGAIDNGHVHIVKYILNTLSLQKIIFESRRLLSAISEKSEMMEECMTDEVVSSMLRCKDDVLENIMSNSELKKHVSTYIVNYLSRSQNIEEARRWNRLAWRLVSKSEMVKLLEESSAEKLACILDCDGAAEGIGSAWLLHMLSTEKGKRLLRDTFVENKHSRLREVLAKLIESRRSADIKLITLMLGNEKETAESSKQLSYTEICDLSMDSIASKSDRTVLERLGRIASLDSTYLLSIYKQILFRHKVHTDRDEFRGLSQDVLERLHKCFDENESETEVELVARKLERQQEQVPLNIHVFCMLYDEYNGRYRKSDGLIRNVLYGNYCGMCRKALIDEKPREDDNTDEPVCPVCTNDYDKDAECSKVVYKALACGHVYHITCLNEWMESDQFDNECPYESCQKPVVPGLSEDEVVEIRERNIARIQRETMIQELVDYLQKIVNEAVNATMNDPQNSEAIQHNTRFNMLGQFEVRRLFYLMALDEILKQNRKKLMEKGIYEEVKKRLGFNEQELMRLQLKYPWVEY